MGVSRTQIISFLSSAPTCSWALPGDQNPRGIAGHMDRCHKIHRKGISCSAWRIQGSLDVSSAGHKALIPRIFLKSKWAFPLADRSAGTLSCTCQQEYQHWQDRLHLWVFGFLHPGDRAKGSQVLVWDHFLTFLHAALATGAALAGLCHFLFLVLTKSPETSW